MWRVMLLLIQLVAPVSFTVRLRDIEGVGIAGVTIVVRDESGAHELGRAETNNAGIATFSLATGSVRVAVLGTLPDHTPLQQPGDDAQGIRLQLNGATPQLDLRIERDGLVLPDPTTMIALDQNLPPVLVAPTALLASTPTRTSSQTVSTPFSPDSSATNVSVSSGSIWLGIALVTAVLGGLVAVLILQSRWRRQ